ncbi:MAG: hypothetical protein JST43_08935 [Bacteroidetes bacterium]|nr:hypothetical protein [Bacteroidota bacterium]MBS1539467.1 hypothetical protein [Bacteroidota bacterium]
MRRLYLETSPEETKAIDKALLCDSTLQQQYSELVALKKELDMATANPSEAAVQNILNYARGLQEHH